MNSPSTQRASSDAAQASQSAVRPARRGFLGVLFGSYFATGMTALTATGAAWLAGLGRFMFANVVTEPPARVKIGPPEQFAAESVDTRFKRQHGFWVVCTTRDGQRQIVALRAVCTHLRCTPNWSEHQQKFKCPCHGSGFDRQGHNVEGPAPRPLERFAIHLADDGQLEVDRSRTFQQELGEWDDPASFHPV